MIIDVYYKDDKIEGFTAAVIDIHESWDGSLYGECNLMEACGAKKFVKPRNINDTAQVDDLELNAPARWMGTSTWAPWQR